MRYKIYDNGELVNTIVADEDFVVALCDRAELSYEADEISTSAEERREAAYNTEEVIEWDGGMITVTHAALLWQYYAAEGSPVAAELTELIADAKADIRQRIHD